jgi:hypothetical protein
MNDRPLEDLKTGEAIQYELKDWFVKDRSVYKESDDYKEIQWTVHNDKEGECYLLRSEEKKEGGFEYVWVFTKPVNINAVEYKSLSDKWEFFKENDFMAEPPKELKFDNMFFTYEAETSGEAQDDEGLMVTKLTWDYYDPSGAFNLAIEVWKEEDRDYPEAYLGLVIEPYKVKILPREKTRFIKRASKKFNLAVLGYGAFGALILWTSGVPLDLIIAFSIPAASLALLVVRYGMPWLYLASFSVWAVMAAFFIITNLGASYWVVASTGVILASLTARLSNLIPLKEDNADYPIIAITGLLPALWIYSFIMYFKFAPGPHTAGQLFMACILPAFASGICYAVNYFLRNLYAQR